ncbi:hypothetical protein l11_16790 [Neisseria weaveri LMG 5135]|nr:hypothetical protein l11_16790 [Neisseria weaveri LMG 5135]EGV37853.1 hypothetical protein l13_02370 [Neisseria weaveri ATCC 51223]
MALKKTEPFSSGSVFVFRRPVAAYRIGRLNICAWFYKPNSQASLCLPE